MIRSYKGEIKEVEWQYLLHKNDDTHYLKSNIGIQKLCGKPGNKLDDDYDP